MKEKIKSLAEKFHAELISIRRHIHQNPELSFEEYKTSEYIQKVLTEYDIPFKAGYVNTGIVALIEGKKESSNKKVIALRADMDALPVNEENDIEYKSNNKGVMHACGHDVHTACLLGTAKVLKEIENEFSGTVKLIFQPAEELLPGGGKMMIEEGALENPKPDMILAQHVMPTMDVGTVGFKSGMYMASNDEIYLTIKGKGGHAAMPHQLTDNVLIASHIIVALQQITSRKALSSTPTVLSFGKFIANGATNIIPDEVKIEGTFRTMDEEWRAEAHKEITKIASGIANSMGAECEVNIKNGYPFLINDEKVTEASKTFASEYLDNNNVLDMDIRMTAEDFAYYSQKIPATFYRLGIRNESKNITSSLHTSTFNIDEDAIKTGTGLMTWLAFSFLTNK